MHKISPVCGFYKSATLTFTRSEGNTMNNVEFDIFFTLFSHVSCIDVSRFSNCSFQRKKIIRKERKLTADLSTEAGRIARLDWWLEEWRTALQRRETSTLRDGKL